MKPLTVVKDEQRQKDHDPLLFNRPIVDGESSHVVTEPAGAGKGGQQVDAAEPDLNLRECRIVCLELEWKRSRLIRE